MQPDPPFHNFRDLISGDRRTICSSGTPCDGFWSSKVAKGSVSAEAIGLEEGAFHLLSLKMEFKCGGIAFSHFPRWILFICWK